MPALNLLTAEDHVNRVVAESKSSFYLAMRLLPRARRIAIFALYAFCREVDDIADGDDPPDRKRRLLADWRQELDRVFEGAPTFATGVALADAVRRFDLPRAEFDHILDGMDMDVDRPPVPPTQAELDAYCRCVAGTVGMLSVRIFGDGSPAAERFALVLGEALQYTNVLRDIAEDAGRGVIYLPKELLQEYGVVATTPAAIYDDPALPAAARSLAYRALARYLTAERLLDACDGRALRPARVMMRLYARLLDRMIEHNWQRDRRRVRLSLPETLWVAARAQIA